jgi:hypothetical protein
MMCILGLKTIIQFYSATYLRVSIKN